MVFGILYHTTIMIKYVVISGSFRKTAGICPSSKESMLGRNVEKDLDVLMSCWPCCLVVLKG